MADLSSFADQGFDAKAWVNRLCAQCPSSDPLEKYLAETEMRLQLTAEEIEAGLQDSSAQAMRRIPFAVQEIYRLQGDIQGMRDHVKLVAAQVSTHAAEAAASVSVIRKLDRVKSNMELACSTLKEATELSGLFVKVEEVFASGDLPRVAEMLGMMRRSLALVGDVPEFKAGRGRLRALEDRLQGMVEGSLSQALAQPALIQQQQQQQQQQGADSEAGGDAAGSREEEDQYVAALAGLLLAVDSRIPPLPHQCLPSTVFRISSKELRHLKQWQPSSSPSSPSSPSSSSSSSSPSSPSSSSLSSSSSSSPSNSSMPLMAVPCRPCSTPTRYSTVEALFLDTRLAFVHSLWEEACTSSEDVLVWLPRFYTRLVPVLDAESSWCLRVLPQQQQQLMTALAAAILQKISKATRERLLASRLPVAQLPLLSAEMAAFARSIMDVLPHELPGVARTQLLTSLFQPLEEMVSSYPAMELGELGSSLTTALAAVRASPTAESSAEHLVRTLPGALRAACSTALAAIERCVAFTGGSELPGLYKVLDQALSAWLSRLAQHISSSLAQLTSASSSANPSITPSADQSEQLNATLRLVLLAKDMAGVAFLQPIDTAFRTALSAALPKLTAAAATAAAGKPAGAGVSAATGVGAMGAGGLGLAGAQAAGAALSDPLVVRLGSGPEPLAAVRKLADSLADARCVALPLTTAQVEALGALVDSAAQSSLMAPVLAALRPLASLAEWQKGSGSPGAAHPLALLPSFAAHPLPYITAQVGEYLMLLPQQLEVLMAGSPEGGEQDAAAQEDELAGQWLDRVVTGSAQAYSDAIHTIPQLSSQGGVQLAADVEYFCNVMSALQPEVEARYAQVAPPVGLLAVQLYAGLAAEQLQDAWKAAVAETREDVAAIRAIAGLRRVKLDT
ncbi:hypothetical protein QJQ45_016704 [Haematococcus lacustris]|nr:hypothetical protein QJQ45_016704 [Haematococcus lacustris]